MVKKDSIEFKEDTGDYFRQVPDSPFWMYDGDMGLLFLEEPDNYSIYTGISKYSTTVIKFSTNVITHEDRRRTYYTMRCAAEEAMWLRSIGMRPVIVTSGAIHLGRNLRLRYGENIPIDEWDSPKQKQRDAKLGQPLLYALWDSVFDSQPIRQRTRESLVVNEHMTDKRMRAELFNGYRKDLSEEVIPIINEDDEKTLTEIETTLKGERVFSDNSMLASLIAQGLLEYGYKSLLINLTNTDGIYTPESYRNKQFQPIRIVRNFDGLEDLVLPEKSDKGRGGMLSTIVAADLATKNGIYVIIANGMYCNHDGYFQKGKRGAVRKFYPIKAIIEGKVVGTRCLPQNY